MGNALKRQSDYTPPTIQTKLLRLNSKRDNPSALYEAVGKALAEYGIETPDQLIDFYKQIGLSNREANKLAENLIAGKLWADPAQTELARCIEIIAGFIGMPSISGLNITEMETRLETQVRLSSDTLQFLRYNDIQTMPELCRTFRACGASTTDAIKYTRQIANGLINIRTHRGEMPTTAWLLLKDNLRADNSHLYPTVRMNTLPCLPAPVSLLQFWNARAPLKQTNDVEVSQQTQPESPKLSNEVYDPEDPEILEEFDETLLSQPSWIEAEDGDQNRSRSFYSDLSVQQIVAQSTILSHEKTVALIQELQDNERNVLDIALTIPQAVHALSIFYASHYKTEHFVKRSGTDLRFTQLNTTQRKTFAQQIAQQCRQFLQIMTDESAQTKNAREILKLLMLDAFPSREKISEIRSSLELYYVTDADRKKLQTWDNHIQNCKDVEQELYLHNIRLILFYVNKNPLGATNLRADLINEGTLGFLTAVRNFDIRSGFKLVTYASGRIRQKIKLFGQENKQTIQLPVWFQDAQDSYYSCFFDLRRKLKRDPNPQEIMNMTGLSEKTINIIQKSNFNDLSLEADPHGNAPSDDEGQAVLDMLETKKPTPEQATENADFARNVREAIRQTLPVDQYNAIKDVYGLDGKAEQSYADVARSLGCSLPTIRHRTLKGIERLAHNTKLQKLARLLPT